MMVGLILLATILAAMLANPPSPIYAPLLGLAGLVAAALAYLAGRIAGHLALLYLPALTARSAWSRAHRERVTITRLSEASLMFKIVAVLIEDDPKVIEAIAPSVLAMQDLGAYATETDGSDALVNLIEDLDDRHDYPDFDPAAAQARGL